MDTKPQQDATPEPAAAKMTGRDIVTVAGMQIARGLARISSGGQGVQISYGDGPNQAPLAFSLLRERTFNGLVPIPVLVFAGVAALAILLLRVSAFSRHVYAVGGN